MRAFVTILFLSSACVSSRHAEVRLANNSAGADCFSRCVATTQGSASVDCVASCPGAVHLRGDCSGGLACVEDRKMRKGLTALAVSGVVLGVIVVSSAASGGGQ